MKPAVAQIADEEGVAFPRAVPVSPPSPLVSPASVSAAPPTVSALLLPFFTQPGCSSSNSESWLAIAAAIRVASRTFDEHRPPSIGMGASGEAVADLLQDLHGSSEFREGSESAQALRCSEYRCWRQWREGRSAYAARQGPRRGHAEEKEAPAPTSTGYCSREAPAGSAAGRGRCSLPARTP